MAKKKLIDHYKDTDGNDIYVYKDKYGREYIELYEDEEYDPDDTGEYYIPETNELDE